MKIFLITLEYPPIVGGISTYLHELYANSEHKVIVIAPTNYQFYSWWFWPRWIPFYFKLVKMVRVQKPDQIHVSHVLPIGIMAHWLKKKFKIPYVIFFHGNDLLSAHAQQGKWKRVVAIVQGAARVIVNSEATKKLYVELLSKSQEPFVVLPGVDIPATGASAFVSGAHQLLDTYALNGTRIILFLARLIPRKGVTVALDAMTLLMKENIEATLVIVGDGPERAAAEQHAQDLNLYNRVRFIGRVSDEQKWKWYSVAHVFWFPAQPIKNDWEGFGIASLEAQSAGCPVVVSNIGGLPESVENNVSGLICEPTAEAFAQTTAQLLNNAMLWQNMRAAARTFASKHSWKKSRDEFGLIIR
ncbi:MAG: glycosyltransferase family 4 protein [Candidatus Magasanikbacteria bacterium]|nr:glycosyltransferase family 4 protein [Candidatus Magasanikbacteria bacterium]